MRMNYCNFFIFTMKSNICKYGMHAIFSINVKLTNEKVFILNHGFSLTFNLHVNTRHKHVTKNKKQKT